jgi:hypothetical protein
MSAKLAVNSLMYSNGGHAIGSVLNPLEVVLVGFFVGPTIGAATAVSLSAQSASKVPIIEVLVQSRAAAIADDAIVNFGSIARAVINPSTGVRSYWFRYGDIKHLTVKQLQTVVGEIAAAGRPGGASVIRVSELPAGAFRQMPPTSAAGITEYIIDATVNVVQNVGIYP